MDVPTVFRQECPSCGAVVAESPVKERLPHILEHVVCQCGTDCSPRPSLAWRVTYAVQRFRRIRAAYGLARALGTGRDLWRRPWERSGANEVADALHSSREVQTFTEDARNPFWLAPHTTATDEARRVGTADAAPAENSDDEEYAEALVANAGG